MYQDNTIEHHPCGVCRNAYNNRWKAKDDKIEVGDEVYAAFEEAGFDMSRIARRYEKWHLDLWETSRMQLLAHGVLPEHIEVAGICTFQHHEDFFSARRLGIKSGRILSGIQICRSERSEESR